MKYANLTTGFYQPTPRFLQILEHTAVMDAETLTLVAVTGPSGDAESERTARLFAQSPRLLHMCKMVVAAADDLPPELVLELDLLISSIEEDCPEPKIF